MILSCILFSSAGLMILSCAIQPVGLMILSCVLFRPACAVIKMNIAMCTIQASLCQDEYCHVYYSGQPVQ